MDIRVEESTKRLEGALNSLENAFKEIRTGGANPSILNKIEVPYYGMDTPLNQVASISVVEGRQLYIKPFDTSLTKEIEKAIFAANLGLTPQNEGQAVRINIPPLTEERRKEFTKVAAKEAEEAKVAIRNVRRDVIEDIKKDKTVPEDLRKAAEDDMNKLTEKYTKKVDELLDAKNKEIMKV